MRLSKQETVAVALLVVTVAIVGALSWDSIKLELLERKVLRWSGVIQATIDHEPAWKKVRGRASMKSGSLYAEIGGTVDSDATLQKLKAEIQATGFPFPVKWRVTVVTNADVHR